MDIFVDWHAVAIKDEAWNCHNGSYRQGGGGGVGGGRGVGGGGGGDGDGDGESRG